MTETLFLDPLSASTLKSLRCITRSGAVVVKSLFVISFDVSLCSCCRAFELEAESYAKKIELDFNWGVATMGLKRS